MPATLDSLYQDELGLSHDVRLKLVEMLKPDLESEEEHLRTVQSRLDYIEPSGVVAVIG